jgi:anti-sigma B factor antagonist
VTLQIKNREVDGVSIVVLYGRIVFGPESSTLREHVKNLIAAGSKKIVLNVEKVDYIDSAGLGTLVAVYHSALSHHASLALCNLGSHFEGTMQLTKLLTIFDAYRTEAEAVRSLAK